MDAEKSLVARLDELARRCERSGRETYTRFLDPAQVEKAVWAAGRAGVRAQAFGGYPDAERTICRFFLDETEMPDWPFCCLQARWDARYASITHRDVLGALMGLGVVRETIGDIVVRDGQVFVFAMCDVADYVAANLERAGRAALHFRRTEELPEIPPPAGRLFRETVASLRLDAVLAAAYRLSRADASEAIREGKVRVNFIEEMRPDAPLGADALLSVRGLGRVRLKAVDGPTRKGRIAIALFRYE